MRGKHRGLVCRIAIGVSGGRYHLWKQAYVNEKSLLAACRAGQRIIKGQCHYFSTSALAGGGWSTPRPASSSATYYTGGCVALGEGLDSREEQRIPSLHRHSNPEASSPWRVAVPSELSRPQTSLCIAILQALDIRKLDCVDQQA